MKGFSRVNKRNRKSVVGLHKLLRFVCDSCRHSNHEQCIGGTWCDCQHKAKK